MFYNYFCRVVQSSGKTGKRIVKADSRQNCCLIRSEARFHSFDKTQN